MRVFLSAFLFVCCLSGQKTQSLEQVIAATPHYDLAINLNPDAHQMDVKGTIRLPPSDKPQEVIELDLSRLMDHLQAEVIEPAASAGAVEIKEGAKKDKYERFSRWLLRPQHPIPARQPVTLRLSYGGTGQSFVFYLGPEGSFGGGSNTVWYPQLDAGSRGCGRLSFTVPAGYTVLATGKKVGETTFENTVPSQFSFAAGKYQVLQRDGVVPMRAYLLHPRKNVDEYLNGCGKVLAFLSKKFGKYPYSEFAIAEVPSVQAHQTGFTGASMNGFMLADKEALDEPFNLAYYGHEISHQWWGNLVTNSSDHGNFMLDEAMAQFGSLSAVAELDGATAAEQYRRTGYPDYSAEQCGYGYLQGAEAGEDQPLNDLKGSNAHLMADSKGFLIWDLLAQTVGREKFDEVLRTVTRDYPFQSIHWEDFLNRVQHAYGKDLSWFYEQWFERTGAPNWQLTWKQTAHTVEGAITQTAPFYRVTLQVELADPAGGRFMKTLEVNGERTEFRWLVPFTVRSVVLDPHFHVLHWLPELRAAALTRGPALHADSLTQSGRSDEAESLLRKALETIPQPDPQGARFWDEQALARVYMARKNWPEAQKHFDAALAAPNRDQTQAVVVYYQYAKLAKAMNDDVKLHWAVQGAIDTAAAIGGSGYADAARALLNNKQP